MENMSGSRDQSNETGPIVPKINITATFPNAAEDFKRRNPHIFPIGNDKTIFKGIGVRKNGHSVGRQMNKTEREFSILLEARKQKGEICGWSYETVKLRLADRTTYTPDFLTWEFAWDDETPVRLCFIEIKGFKREDAMVKYKVAREQFPWATFEMWERKGGSWNRIL